jgi:hypothetical protein
VWNLLRPFALLGIGLVVGIALGVWFVDESVASHEEYGYLRGAADGYNRGRDWAEQERDGTRIVGVAPEHVDYWNVPWPYPAP